MSRPPRVETDALLARMIALVRNLPVRLHERSFWITQAGLLAITALHVSGEFWSSEVDRDFPAAFHHIPVVLYLAPISYASLRYGTEGAVLTGLWSALLTLPSLVLWHTADLEWLTELFFVAVVISVGTILAVPVERERRANRRLQEIERRRVRSYAQLVTQAQEEERKRIARELHDEAAQNAVVMQRQIDAISATLADHPVSGDLRQLRELAVRTLASVRQFIRDLRPPTLDELGLSSALEQLVTEVCERGDLAAQLHIAGSVRRLTSETELTVFRIGQAAVHNAERHARAARIDVDLTFGADSVRLKVADDGRGFSAPDNLEELPQHGKLGLVGMNERARLVGGTLEIQTRPGAGTSIVVEVPG